MKSNVLELVTCKIVSGTTDEALLRAVRASQNALEGYEGYVQRTLARSLDDEDVWIDLVLWSGMKEAHEAAAMFEQEAAAQSLMSLIDPKNVRMQHFERLHHLDVVSERRKDEGSKCVEIITYKLKANSMHERYLQIAADLGSVLRDAEGFIRREVYYYAETQDWAEVIYYRNRDSANAIFETLKDAACMAEGMSLVDEASMAMYFASPVLTFRKA